MEKAYCPYCGQVKTATFTDEHVLPRALGGNLVPTNPFLLRVCDKCNGACGNHVDGPFVKSWFVHNARAQASHSAYDPNAEAVFPLFAMGRLAEWASDETVCDLWLGPAGDAIYHFHKPYPGGDLGVGVPPHVRRKSVDPGTLYIVLASDNPNWHKILSRSVAETFRPKPEIHVMNGAPAGHVPPHPPIPVERKHQADWVSAQRGKEHAVNIAHDMHFSDRFLVKLALGLGTCLYGEAYARSNYARRLRDALWEKDPDARARMPIHGTSFLGGEETLPAALDWKGCHLFYLSPVEPDSIGLAAILYGRQQAVIVISDERSRFAPTMNAEGELWVVAPGLQRFAGPMSLVDYLNDKDLGSGKLSGMAQAFAAAQPLPERLVRTPP